MNETQSNRRTFLKTSGLGAAGLTLVAPQSVVGTQSNSKIQLGIIGSGGRGYFVGKKFMSNVSDDVQLVAAHDYFKDRLERVRQRFGIAPSRCFIGLQGYRQILGDSDVDGVIITSPVYFHPEHTAEAVAAGKHIWLAKPVAVDVPGCLNIKESGRRARGKVTFLVDFQSRNSPYFVEAARRVHQGAIGRMVSGEAFNQFPRAGKADTSGLSKDAARLRNWGTNNILSGDIIVEQAVHAVDIVNWLVGSPPIKAYGTGGLSVRLHAGNNWDHFTVIYWYPDEIVIDLNCSQFMKGYENLGARIFGDFGGVHAHYCANNWGAGPVMITGDKAWKGTPHDNTWDIGVNNNCKDFVTSIRTGEYINHADYAADSTLTSILGRTAAYEQREVTWEEILKANIKLEANLKL